MITSICLHEYGIKVRAEIQSKEVKEEGEKQTEVKEDTKSSQTISSKSTGKDAKDTKKSPKGI